MSMLLKSPSGARIVHVEASSQATMRAIRTRLQANAPIIHAAMHLGTDSEISKQHFLTFIRTNWLSSDEDDDDTSHDAMVESISTSLRSAGM